MKLLTYMSDIIIPLLIFYIVGYGLVSKVKVYEAFLDGARDGLKIVVKLIPTVVGLMIAVGVLRVSGFFDMLGTLIKPVTDILGVPGQIVPLIVVKLFSSSAATGLLLDIFQNEGPDSFVGMIASILLSSTETVFYTMSLYFITVKVARTKYTLAGALIATLVGTVLSVFLAGLM